MMSRRRQELVDSWQVDALSMLLLVSQGLVVQMLSVGRAGLATVLMMPSPARVHFPHASTRSLACLPACLPACVCRRLLVR